MGGRIEEYEEDSIIIGEGEKNDKMFIVLEGTVALYMNYRKENEYVIGIKGKNKLFGDMSMLANEESMYTAVAFSDVKLAWFQENNLEAFFAGYPKCAVDFIKNVAKNDALMRKRFSMLIEEISELDDVIVDKSVAQRDAARMSAREMYSRRSSGVGKLMHLS